LEIAEDNRMSVFDVQPEHIERLEPGELARLLRQLLYLEAERYGIPGSAVSVPLQISVPDGGEDGRISWEDGVERTDFIPRRFTVFQSKAQEVKPTQCAREVAPGGDIKTQVRDALEAGGAYILFCGHPYNERLKKSRIESIRQALKGAGRHDWETALVDFYEANKIASWVNNFFPAQVHVLECNDIAVDLGAKSWQQWASHKDFRVRYVPNDKLNDLLKAVRDTCHEERWAPLRITGLSGLGKTRLVLEAFKPVAGSHQYRDNDLQERIAYIDAAMLENQRVVELLNQLIKLKRSGILVVDNCEPLLHRELVKELGYGDADRRISLITLDFEPDERSPMWRSIELKPEHCAGIVRGIVVELYPGIGGPEISRIEDFAQGFAGIAVLVGRQMTDGGEDIGRTDAQIVNHLLSGRERPDTTTDAVVTACSLFEHFEFSEETVTPHIAFMAERIAEVKHSDFFSVCARLLDRGILQRRGRFARICPIPLAITLAARWLDERPRDQLVELVGHLKEHGLFEQFCNQLTKLSFCRNANQLVPSLIGPQGPFGSPEALLTEEGSRLFRGLVEVDPQTTTETLWRVLSGKSRSEMLNIRGDVRRNLVWSLKNLCWWPDTFNRAAAMVLSLAAAENETWGNNATGEFVELFHVSLPGTEANLAARLDLIKAALASPDPETHILAIKAAGSALETQSFTRGYGPEAQGSRAPRADYSPTWGEAREYWAKCIGLLVKEITGQAQYVALAKSELAQQMRGLLRRGIQIIEEIKTAIRAITEARGRFWPEALVAVRNCLEFDVKDLPPEWLPQIAALEKMLLPANIEERLRLIVSVPDWRNRKGEDGGYVSVATEEAEGLAEELSSDSSWYAKVDLLRRGEQRQAYAFGKRLGELVGAPQLFIDKCLDCLRGISSKEAAPELLGAFLAGLPNPDLVANTMDRIIADAELVRFCVRITRCLDITEAHLQRLVPVICDKRVPITDFGMFSYGRALDKISEVFVSGFCEKLAGCGLEGARCALHVLFMYCYGSEQRFTACSEALRTLIMTDGLLATDRRESMLSHYWEVASVKLLSGGPPDPKLAESLTEKVIDMACQHVGGGSLSTESARTVLEVILRNYFLECWPIVGRALLQRRPRFALGHLLGMGSEKDKKPQNVILDTLPTELVMQWCQENVAEGPAALAYIVPIFATVKPPVWHPLARRLIDDFGRLAKVLHYLSDNMFSFSSWGSRAPYYERRITLLEQLRDHVRAEVRTWAEEEIRCYEKERKQALERDDERKWGIV
jgi:hypothetical protein